MRDLISRSFKFVMVMAVMSLLPVRFAVADYVGEMETTKYFDAATVQLIQSKLPGGLKAGDQVSYIIQFTPTDNGGAIGGGGYVTDYIPANTIVVNAQFIHLNPDGTFTQIDPPTPGSVTPAYVPLYSDTGIFYSTDARTAMYTTPTATPLSQTNGYNLVVQNPGCTGVSLPSSTHNAWDNSMVKAFAGANGMTGGTCAVPPAQSNYSSTSNGGLSPVAGPDTYLTLDYTGAVGPWQRIKYQGSKKGIGTPVAGINAGSCVGGADTSAGHDLKYGAILPDVPSPLPSATNAVRFAAGKVVVGELFSARITLQLAADMQASGIINNTEVFGGDASIDVGNAAAHPSTWNQWRYFCPAVAVSNSNLMLVKTLVGTCTGTGCTPTPVTAGVVPNAANLKLRYQVQYLNTGFTAQSNVVLTDTLATGAAYVVSSYSQVSGTSIGAPAGTTTLTFPTIASLAPGAGGTVQYDVNVATAQADGTALVNTARLVSVQLPSPGVTSRAIATVSTQANLWIGKTANPSTVASGGTVAPTVTYTITIPNNGGTAVVASSSLPITVNDYLPTDGLSTAVADRFSYVAGSVSASTYTSAGVATTLTPAVTDVAPATASAKETITFKLTSGTIPIGGKLVITFNAAVGTNVPAQTTPYVNNANVFYSYGPGGTGANSSMSETIGTAPVTVTSVLSLTKKVNCVYTPVTSTTCVPYASGAIPTGSKIKYQLDYKNISGSALSNVLVTDTLPTSTSFVSGSASTANQPTVTGQVLTFTAITSLAASATGTITFDVDASAVATNTDITNVAKITATNYPAGIQASVTSSVRDQVLQIIKTVSPASVQPGGVVTYSITVKNLSATATASAIQIYDELPYDASVTTANAVSEFRYLAAGTFTAPTAPSTVIAVTPTVSVPPTFPGYTGFANQQEVYWNFGDTTKTLAPGASFTYTYTATAGSAIPASTKIYTSDVNAKYTVATLAMTDSIYGVAGVRIGGLDHIQISHSGTGLTCQPSNITLTACADAACGTYYTNGVTGTLSPGGAFSISSAGTMIVPVSQTTAGPVTFSAGGITPTPLATPQYSCLNTATNTASCTMIFSTAGFVITVPNHTACTNVPVSIAAMQANTSNICVPAYNSINPRSVNLNIVYTNPNTGTKTVTDVTNASSIGTTPSPHNLTFNTGIATINISYPDVGTVTLTANDTAPNGAPMTGSAPFTAVPATFAFSGITTGPIKAGNNFSATISAMTGTSTTCSAAQVAPNFGKESAPESVTLSYAKCQPTGANASNGVFTGGGVIANTFFSNGVASLNNLNWSEVGNIDLNAALTNTTYLGSGIATTQGTTGTSGTQCVGGVAGKVGNFVPDHFTTVATGPMGCPTGLAACATTGGLVYSGQPFSVIVTAMNGLATPTTTQNYDGTTNTAPNFASTVTLGAWSSVGGSTASPGALSNTSIAASNFNKGLASISASATSPYFTFTTTPTIPTNIYLRAADVTSTSLQAIPANSVEGGVTVVSGQVKINNAYGSELLPLMVTATAQYYSPNSVWVISITDNITALTLPSSYPVGAGNANVTPTPTATMNAGKVNINLSKPGVPGVVTINPLHPNSSYLPLTPGTATFGIYNGNNNNIIYKRESY